MRPDDWMKKHLAIVTEVDGKQIGNLPVEDPFHTTNVTVGLSFWGLLKMLLGLAPREIHVRVKVRSNGVSQGRWFQRAEICEKCKRTRIDDIRHPQGHDHGYHHGDERWCHDCYYDIVTPCTAQAVGEGR